MPELTGDEMVRRIRALRPDSRSLRDRAHRSVDGCAPVVGGERFSTKPFTPVGLREAVALLLHGTLKEA
jgi:hypothetical protein